MKLLRWFGDGYLFGKIYPVEKFHRVIEKERERSDRTGLDVSMVVFKGNGRGPGSDAGHYRDLIWLLLSRIRATDDVGWFDEKRVGVVLPHTGGGDALKFASFILKKLSAGADSFDFRIFTYPSSWPGNGNGENGEGEQLLFDDYSEKWSRKRGGSNIFFHELRAMNGMAHFPPDGSGENRASGSQEFSPFNEPLHFSRLPLWKRALDVTGSAAGLILLFPLFLAISVVIKLTSPGPVFFRQERVGHLGKVFPMLKFRTMHVDADISSHRNYLGELIRTERMMTKLDDREDPRIFLFGKILRKSALDELPQLVNILRGEMSIVGPRPCMPYEAERYLIWHAKRFDAVPGLTGLWQVSGKNKTTFMEMIRFDIEYGRKKSLFFDLSIILRTIPTVIREVTEGLLKRKEAEYAEDH